MLMGLNLYSVFKEVQVIKQLIYVSRPAKKLSENDIDKILVAARGKNLERRITGFLLFDGRMFMQLIEGPPREVDDLFEGLLGDTRHQKVQKIYDGAATGRLFSNFSMAFAHLGGEADFDFGGSLSRHDARQLAQTLRANPTKIRNVIADSLLDLLGDREDANHSVFALGQRDRKKPDQTAA